MTKTYTEQYYHFYARFLLHRYEHALEETVYTCPYSGKPICYPPCFVTPEVANPEFARNSCYHQSFVKPFVPENVTIENLILDELFKCEGRCADERMLLCHLRVNPFIQVSDEGMLNDVVEATVDDV